MTKNVRFTRLDETIARSTMIGDLWQMTWGEDGSQFVGQCDGWGSKELPEYTGEGYTSRMYRIEDSPPDVHFSFLPGYPDLVNFYDNLELAGRYYGMGILAVDGRIYHFMSSFKRRFLESDNGFAMVKLIYSDNNGLTWHNQDGSTPVQWEGWDDRSRENMLFYREPNDAFSMLSVVQMGRNYELNRDGYVYIYSPNGNVDGLTNQLVLARVRKDRILHRDDYEYFQAIQPDGQATWSPDIGQRGVVQTFPKGWVNWKSTHPWGWLPSVTYNPGLQVYMMATWGTGVKPDGGDWFEKPSYLGFWTAPNPWGPWSQQHEETAWLPGGNPNSRAYAPQISPKWIAEDGRSFWLVYTDFRTNPDAAGTPIAELTAEKNEAHLPDYRFLCQKVLIEELH